MSYKTDIAILRQTIEKLGYKLIPNVLDIQSEDLSDTYKDMGFTLIPTSILDEDVTNGSTVGTRSFKLQTTYYAQNEKQYDILWEKFEVVYREIHKICHNIENNQIIKLAEKQYIYLGDMEFYYGQRSC